MLVMDDQPQIEEQQEQDDETTSRLANPVLRSLERGPVRMRESGVTHAGWRMELDSDQGEGAITLIETTAGQPFFRGQGVCLGWEQEDLSMLYHSLRAPGEPDLVFNQLG
jgi:hypothetical protein